MTRSISKTLPCWFLWCFLSSSGSCDTTVDQEDAFQVHVRPFMDRYCAPCHEGERPKAKFDISPYRELKDLVADFGHMDLMLERLELGDMPPEDAQAMPTDQERLRMIQWMRRVKRAEAEKNADDPGWVVARRLSHSEFAYVLQDLTGLPSTPSYPLPVDPANEQGFDNTGESLSVSPALIKKYLEAAREVVDHLVMTPSGLHFAPQPVSTETDRDQYGVQRIVAFYRQQNTDLKDYFHAALQWKYRDRFELGGQMLEDLAAEKGLSRRYLQSLWECLEGTLHGHGPIQKLRALWQALPEPMADGGTKPSIEALVPLVDYVSAARQKIQFDIPHVRSKGIHNGAQAFVMWRNRQKAAHRMKVDLDRLAALSADDRQWLGLSSAQAPASTLLSEDEKESVIFFGRLFPDRFYVAERGREFLDPDANREKAERGRLLSAGFHSMMGYFRDDQPLCALMLEQEENATLDRLWDELDFMARAPMRQHQGLVWFERTDSKFMRDEAFDFARAEDKDVTSEPKIRRLADVYLEKALSLGADALAVEAIQEHFDHINRSIRQVESWEQEARYHHLRDLERLAEKAYRRPLEGEEAESLRAFYRRLIVEDGLSHEQAVRDTLVSVLVSPHFWFRMDMPAGLPEVHPLPSLALANRLSFFLWSSMPDEALMADANTEKLLESEVLMHHFRRMIRDPRMERFATEFLGNWLGFRRFEEHNSVDRERFPAFTPALREAMFQEPIRFFCDLVLNQGSALECLFADHTMVNALLADHYGLEMPPQVASQGWARLSVGDSGRGGLLPMGVFLTMNAPGLRTSPVKRGYWVVRQLLGEHIAPPPPNVPDLPSDERLMEASLPAMLARHREVRECAQCHEKFDSIGLSFEGFGPVGELRTLDLADRPIADLATFPDGSEGAGLKGLLAYIKADRQRDFLEQLAQKLFTYAMGRAFIPSDELFFEALMPAWEEENYRLQWLMEQIVLSPHFLNRRGPRQTISSNLP